MPAEPTITVKRGWKREYQRSGSEGWVSDDTYTITNPDGSVVTTWWLDPKSRQIFERQERERAERHGEFA